MAQIMKLRDVFSLEEAGAAHGYDSQRHSMSYLPNETPRGGQSGSPSTSASSSYSRFSQNTSTEDDIDDWMGDPEDEEDVGATFDPPYDLNRWRFYMDPGHPDSEVHEGKMIRQYIRTILLELRKGEPIGPPIKTSIGDFLPRGRTTKYMMYKHASSGVIVGVSKEGRDFVAYNFEDHFQSSGVTLEDALVQSVTSDELAEGELDEVSAVGGGAAGSPGQPSGQIRGHIGPMGTDNRSPYLKKDKKKKKKTSFNSFGGGEAE